MVRVVWIIIEKCGPVVLGFLYTYKLRTVDCSGLRHSPYCAVLQGQLDCARKILARKRFWGGHGLVSR
jgi:hypothetical protein